MFPNAVLLLLSGATLAMVTSLITEKGFARPSAQLLPYAKYLTIIAYSVLQRIFIASPRAALSRKGTRLVVLIGTLSVVAYCCFCLGFALAGTGLALGMHAATSQTFTAIFSRLILKKNLSVAQCLAVMIVNIGLLLRSFAPVPGNSNMPPNSLKDVIRNTSADQFLGGIAIITASICYALLGVVFDHLLRIEKPAPPYSQIMEVEGWLGMIALSIWQSCYTIPNFEREIRRPFRESQVTFGAAAALLVASGVIFVWHYFNMGAMFKSDGAVAVGLVNAVRGAVVAVVAGEVHCSAAKPEQCNSRWTVGSAVMVAFGAALWVLGPAPPKLARD